MTHPNEVLALLESQVKSAKRVEKLKRLNELCEQHFQSGSLDFSIPTIGGMCEKIGLVVAKGLYAEQARPYRQLIDAWHLFAESASMSEKGVIAANDPQHTLNTLLSKSRRSDRHRNLRAINELCSRQYKSGSLDFTVGTIGALCESAGILQKKSLSNPMFQDYRTLIEAWDKFVHPWHSAEQVIPEGAARVQKSYDKELDWVAQEYPELNDWRVLAVDWLKRERAGLAHKIPALGSFFKKYLSMSNVPKLPRELLARNVELPNFRAVACPQSRTGVTYNNCISDFIDYVLLRDFSFIADDDVRVVSPAFRNPIPKLTGEGEVSLLKESVRKTLPYGYIDSLRRILIGGPNFQDWKFAQTALGVDIGERGGPGRDWFDVTEEMADRNDPDCVLRVRSRRRNGKVEHSLQMWSPVRWVALAIKLLIPLRTGQVRLLDSGEYDDFIYSKGTWVRNPLFSENGQKGLGRRQGVLRRYVETSQQSKEDVILYINTNKTADMSKFGASKGYEVGWHQTPAVVDNVYYWLEKLRDWQAKYNPVSGLTSWTSLDARHIPVKSESQLASYPNATFLFRMAEGKAGERHLPITDGVVDVAWCNLLVEQQDRLAANGEVHDNGSPVILATKDETARLSTPFPLHSLRVSLITALVLDGDFPFSLMQKVAGHSRILMTLYYTKPGVMHTKRVLAEADAKLAKAAKKTITDSLANAEYENLVEKAVCNSESALAAAVPAHPASRNAAGWMLMHHGLCLVGGNTSELEDNSMVGGCYNGGENIGSESTPRYTPVPGGSRNCIRCRWFITEPHFLPALAAHFNTVAYHFDEARNKSMALEETVQELKRRKAEMESAGIQFSDFESLRVAERTWETAIKKFSDLAEDLVACWRLVERCQELVNSPSESGGQQLVLLGTVTEVESVFEEIESELLQLSGVCGNLELYPDLIAERAVIRRSQLLDSALYNEGLPPIFMTLSEKDQLVVGNAFMRKLAHIAYPQDAVVGNRKVIELMDAGKKLGDALGVSINKDFMTDTLRSTDVRSIRFSIEDKR
jgi:hypothetical protein